jgi:hypothetical protein
MIVRIAQNRPEKKKNCRHLIFRRRKTNEEKLVKTFITAAIFLGLTIMISKAGHDSLAPRDESGLLHQMPNLNDTDFAPRHQWRFVYYLESNQSLTRQRAYVGALQRDLFRLGYYCGPIDGVFSAEVSDAIARLQKSYSMPVTGTLTYSVRRALYLP